MLPTPVHDEFWESVTVTDSFPSVANVIVSGANPLVNVTVLGYVAFVSVLLTSTVPV